MEGAILPRELFLACAVCAVVAPIFAAALEYAWTKRNAHNLAVIAQIEGMR